MWFSFHCREHQQDGFSGIHGKHIFKPLNMDGTQVRDYKLSKLKNILPTYKGDGEDRFTVTTCDFMAGDGGVYSHIKDLKKWSKFGGAPREIRR